MKFDPETAKTVDRFNAAIDQRLRSQVNGRGRTYRVSADPSACPRCGRENCEGCGPAPSKQAPVTRLRAVHANEIIAAPRPVAIVEGVAYADRVTALVAESGAGKTFVALDQMAHVSADMPWHGRDVEHGSGVIAAFEGDAIGLRLRAQREIQGHRLEHVYIVSASEPISPRLTRDGEERSPGELSLLTALDDLAETLKAQSRPPIRLITIDTARASMTGPEESSEHVSAYLRAGRRILAHHPGAAMLITHHAGWQDGESPRKRERGSSAWRGNVDCTLYLERGEYDRERGTCELTLRTLKARDDEPAPPLRLIRRRVELAELDRHGRPVTSCVIERDRRTPEDRKDAERQEAETAARALDLRTLRLMADRPDVAKSQDQIRRALGTRRDDAYASISRLIDRGWALPPERQRQPYIVTAAGQTALMEAPIP